MHKNDRLIILIGIFVVLIALIGAAIGGRPKVEDIVVDEKENIDTWPVGDSGLKHLTGTLNEGFDETVIILINESYITKVEIILNWLDEAPTTFRHENQPDSFNFTIYTPWGAKIKSDVIENVIGQAGQIQEEVEVPEDGVKTSAAQGEWEVNIICISCGEQTLKRPTIGLLDVEDTGNAWELSYKFWFHTNTIPQ